jgi:monofunctional glycosyltransferase
MFRRWLWRAAGCLVLIVALYQAWAFGHIWWWIEHNPASSSFMDAHLESAGAEHQATRLRHRWVPYERISDNLKRAVVAAEDAKFIEHEGFDWQGMYRALALDFRKQKVVAGGSTISQQLAKNLFLSGRRTPWRKAEEALITLMLEKMMSKRRILEIYLNVIEWGDGVFGAEAAAQRYFNSSAARLSPERAARLAAIVPNPRFYEKHPSAPGLRNKTAIILARIGSAEIPE